jgi:hypothetical protein
MTLAQATSLFIETQANDPTSSSPNTRSALRLLTQFFPNNTTTSDLTLSGLREFLTRWYIDEAASQPDDKACPNELLPTPDELIDVLVRFFFWLDATYSTTYSTCFSDILAWTRTSVPIALQLTSKLTDMIRRPAGAFSFPEFLTSFEEGGRSQYNVDWAGETSAMDGYFRIVSIEGSTVEALELLTDETVAPIDIPAAVAETLQVGYVINLEIVREQNSWKIVGCGFAYPPEFEI